MLRKLLGLLACMLLIDAAAAALPYDEQADARADVARALAQARNGNKKVLMVFGANWCPDCRALDKALHGRSAALIDSKFVVVKIDVGNFNKNLDLAQSYGNPIRKGIPAAVLLGADNRILYATKAGELADARHMGEHGIYEFFSRVSADYR